MNASYSYHHNLVAHHKSRMPRPGSYDGMTTNLDFRNNVLYNWLDGPGYSEDHDPGEFVNMNYVGNYGIAAEDGESPRPQVAGFVMRKSSIGSWQLSSTATR